MNTSNGHDEFAIPLERKLGTSAQREQEPFVRAQQPVPERPTPPGSAKSDAQRGQSALGAPLRRAASRLPDDDSKRETLLLLADRIDTTGDRLAELARNPIPWVALAAGAGAIAYALHASRPKPWFERIVPQGRSWLKRAFR